MRINNVVPDPPAFQTEIMEVAKPRIEEREQAYVPDVCANCPDSSCCRKASDRVRGRYADNPLEDLENDKRPD